MRRCQCAQIAVIWMSTVGSCRPPTDRCPRKRSSASAGRRRGGTVARRNGVTARLADRSRDRGPGILQMRSLPGQRKLDFHFSRIVHQVAVICRFALLEHKKTRGGGGSGENKSRPFGRAFLNCFRARNHGDATRRTRPLQDEKQAELRHKWRIREFGSLRVDHFD